MHRDDMPNSGLQFHLHVVVPRRQVADIRVELEPRVVEIAVSYTHLDVYKRQTKSQLRIVSLMTLRLASSAWGETILMC